VRQIGKLSAKKVAKLKTPGRHGDGGNLYLQIANNGSKSWVFRYDLDRAEGLVRRERQMGLGPTHTVTLAEAREKARLLRQQLLDGRDPLEVRRAEQDAYRAAEADRVTFKMAAADYIEVHASSWRNEKHAKQWTSTFTQHVYPKIGDRPVGTIDPAVINEALTPIWSRIPETASRVRQRIERVVRWVREGRPLPRPTAARTVKHFAALPYRDMPSFMLDLREREGTAARALEFVILTAARTGEAIGATWDEIDLVSRTWSIPGSRMKAGKPHTVPLSDQAVSLLETLPRESGNPFLFLGQREGHGLSNMALLVLLRRMKRDDATPHGMRSAFRDWCGDETDFPRELAEHALAHVIKGKTEKAYRRSDALARRARLMQSWANFCHGSVPAVEAAPVVALRRA
jgi:integrase